MPASPSDPNAVARLIDRLLADPGFCASFRQQPAASCRAAGLDELAEDVGRAREKPLETLDVRESRSGMVGVVLAAALEGIELAEYVRRHAGDVSAEVEEALGRVRSPTIRAALGDAIEHPSPPAVAAKHATPRNPEPSEPTPQADIRGEGSRARLTPPARHSTTPSARRDSAHDEAAARSRVRAGARNSMILPTSNVRDAAARPQDAIATPDGARTASPARPGTRASTALEAAKDHIGTPYLWGGSSPKTGFDCSGLVQWAYAKAGIRIPRVAEDQFKAPGGRHIGRGDLLPGDLVFFKDPSGYVYHVGISLGGDKFIHAPRTNDVVKQASLDEPYFAARLAGGRRFDPADNAVPGQRQPRQAAQADLPRRRIGRAEVAAAREAARQDAAEAGRRDSVLFTAIQLQERRKYHEGALSGTDHPDAIASAPSRAHALDDHPLPGLPGGPGAYPGEDASQAELGKWLARHAQDAGLPPELPVMAALVESDLRNLKDGDADSVGFFQMRLSVWNRGEFAGYPERPELQIRWFIDEALAVKRQRQSRGLAVDDHQQWGQWIADIERPAEQFRGRYQAKLAEARELLRR